MRRGGVALLSLIALGVAIAACGGGYTGTSGSPSSESSSGGGTSTLKQPADHQEFKRDANAICRARDEESHELGNETEEEFSEEVEESQAEKREKAKAAAGRYTQIGEILTGLVGELGQISPQARYKASWENYLSDFEAIVVQSDLIAHETERFNVPKLPERLSRVSRLSSEAAREARKLHLSACAALPEGR